MKVAVESQQQQQQQQQQQTYQEDDETLFQLDNVMVLILHPRNH
jgi:hypothetical protein